MGTFFIVAYFHYPEVKGRSAAEIDEMFTENIPARAFKGIQPHFQLRNNITNRRTLQVMYALASKKILRSNIWEKMVFRKLRSLQSLIL